MKLNLIYKIQKKVIKHLCTGMQPHKYNGQLLRNLLFRIKIRGEIEWGKA